MTRTVQKSEIASAIGIKRADASSSIFAVMGRDAIAVKAGTVVTICGGDHLFETDTPVDTAGLVAGQDYAVVIGDGGEPVAVAAGPDVLSEGIAFGGFHFAPGGNADARSGGDTVPAINPFSCWDIGFRPACPDPRGMALVDGRFWADIYLLGADHRDQGTSRRGAVIADGNDLPQRPDGGRYEKLDFATASAIYAHHGKQLLGAEEFFAAAYGVTERASRDGDPSITGDVAAGAGRFTSKWGLFDATGSMWQWGTDGDPDDPRASLFGGSWWSGGYAGSRYALLGGWPEYSNESLSARGRSDHLMPA